MHSAVLALLIAGLAADTPVPVSSTSPTAELITVTLAGMAAIITAAAGFAGLRRRRQAEADAVPLPAPADLEDRPSRIRERLTALETRATITDRELADVKEQLQLRRAIDVVTESDAAPHRRKRQGGTP